MTQGHSSFGSLITAQDNGVVGRTENKYSESFGSIIEGNFTQL